MSRLMCKASLDIEGSYEQRRQMFQSLGTAWAGMIIHHDRDPVYAGYAWIRQVAS